MIKQANIIQGLIICSGESNTILVEVVNYTTISFDYHAIVLALCIPLSRRNDHAMVAIIHSYCLWEIIISD